MKKSVLPLILLACFITTGITASSAELPVLKIPVKKQFTRLQVADHVTILLVNTPSTEIAVRGSDPDLQRARVAVKNGCLHIWMAGSADGKNVTVEVPASYLQQIIVDGDSHIRSQSVLTSPQLEVLVNGACRLELRSQGKIDVQGTPDYEFNPSGNK